MQIYTIIATNNYEWINAMDKNDYENFNTLNGEYLGAKWKPIKIKTVKADKRQKKLKSDFPFLGSDNLIFRSKVKEEIGTIIESFGEILKLQSDEDDEFYCLNIKTYDWLDYEKSEIQYIPNTKKIMRIKKIVPNEKWGKDTLIFKFSYRASSVIVNQDFVNLYKDKNFVGLTFQVIGNFT